MTKNYLLLLSALLLMGQLNLNAQKLTFEDVAEVRLQDMAPIYQHDIVKGYFSFYYLDKAPEKYMANFKLVLLDENLNKLAEKKLVENRRTELKFGAYNGNSILFVLYNPGNVTLEFRRYDLQLNQISSEIRKIGHIEEYFITAPYAGQQHVPPHVYSLDSLGYIFYNFTGMGGVKYKMQYLPDDKSKSWMRETGEKDRDGHLPAPLAHNGKVLLQNFTHSSTPSKYLQAINLETGRVIFDKETLIDKYTIQVFYAYPDADGNFVVTGQYYEKGENTLKGNSLGIFVGKINEKGDFLAHKFHSWTNEVSKIAKCDENGKIEGKGYIFFRDAVHTKDGKLYLAGEMFDRENVGMDRGIEIRDFVIVEINPDMELHDIRFFEKRKHYYSIGGFLAPRNPDLLANYVRMSGGFDYQYVQTGENNDAFTFYYSFLVDLGGKWKKYEKWLGTISKHASDAAYETDKISLKTEADYFQVLPAKAGHLLIVEYFIKAKKLDMRIEKFNY